MLGPLKFGIELQNEHSVISIQNAYHAHYQVFHTFISLTSQTQN